MNCVYCNEPVATSPNSGNYKKVEGWVKLRAKGANEVKFRVDLDEFMHRECMRLRSLGISEGQEAMFHEKHYG